MCLVRISAKARSVSSGEKMVICYILERVLIDNKVAFELVLHLRGRRMAF